MIKKYKKPNSFDNNLVVIGAGSGGLISAYIAAVLKAKVTLIEKNDMGGDCLNTGCVPSKALIKAASIAHRLRTASSFGINVSEVNVDFEKVMAHVHNAIAKIAPHDSVERYSQLGVEVIKGEANIISPYKVSVNGRTITTKNIIIATGGYPFLPPIKGLENVDVLTSDNLWQLKQLPKRLVCVGGGPISCEITQAFARLGANVTQVQSAARILEREDENVSAAITTKFSAEGIRVLTAHFAKAVVMKNNEKYLICQTPEGTEVELVFDALFVAAGRRACVSGFGIEELGIKLSENGNIAVNDYLQTNYANIYAVGDVSGKYQFTHTAGHMAYYAVVNAFFGKFKKSKVDYSVVPWATFVDPEVARVGLNETEAKAQQIDYEITQYGIDDLDRAIAEGEDSGWVSILTEPCKDKILGVTIVGAHAGDLIHEFIVAMKHNIGLNKILGTIHIYPTFAESAKLAAGQWKRARTPEKALKWLAKYHRFLRR